MFIQLSRIIACLGVCGVHIGYGYEVKGIGGVLSVGRYGLFVFFVLSGFLACMWNGEDRRTYIKKKIIRLAPIYYMSLVFCYVIHRLILCETHGNEANWLRYILGLNAWLPAEDIFWKGMHANWYVSVVWGFYIIVAFLWKRVKRTNDGFLYIAFLICSVCSIVIKQRDAMWSVNGWCYLQFFILGMIAHQEQEKKKLIVLPIIAILCVAIKPSYHTMTIFLSAIYSLALGWLSGKFQLDTTNRTGKILSHIDGLIYAVFLVHPFIIDFAIDGILAVCVNKTVAIVVTCTIIIGLAEIVHCCLEKPIQKYLMDKVG